MVSDRPLLLFLARDLDARAKNERYRSAFRLTQDERLDGHTDCTLWTPFTKMHVVGQLFISNNYICFSSKEEDLCQLIIPLREVRGQVGTPCVPRQFGTRSLPIMPCSARCLWWRRPTAAASCRVPSPSAPRTR